MSKSGKAFLDKLTEAASSAPMSKYEPIGQMVVEWLEAEEDEETIEVLLNEDEILVLLEALGALIERDGPSRSRKLTPRDKAGARLTMALARLVVPSDPDDYSGYDILRDSDD